MPRPDLLPRLGRAPLALLALLLAVDLALVVAHLVGLWPLAGDSPAWNGYLDRSPWSISADNGVPEVYGYAKVAAVVALLVLLGRAPGRRVLLGWAGVYVLVVLDDALRLHEDAGAAMVAAAGLPVQGFVLRYQDWGEVTFWALAALVPLVVLVVLHRRADAAGRRLSATVAVLVAALVLCEVGLDQLHAVVGGMRRAALVGVVEDGGAMLVLSASVAVVLALWQQRRSGAGRDGRRVAAGVSG